MDENNENVEIICPKCGTTNPLIQTVVEGKKRNPLMVLFYIFLLFIPIVGWIALFFFLIGRSTVTVTYATCQNCGNSWKLN